MRFDAKYLIRRATINNKRITMNGDKSEKRKQITAWIKTNIVYRHVSFFFVFSFSDASTRNIGIYLFVYSSSQTWSSSTSWPLCTSYSNFRCCRVRTNTLLCTKNIFSLTHNSFKHFFPLFFSFLRSFVFSLVKFKWFFFLSFFAHSRCE